MQLKKFQKKIVTPDDYQPGPKKPKMKKEKVWLVDLLISRKFIEKLSRELIDLYDEDADLDTVDDDVEKSTATNAANTNTAATLGDDDVPAT